MGRIGGDTYMKRLEQAAFWVAILSAGKLITDAFDVNIITDEQVNAIANGMASLFTVVGVAWGILFKKAFNDEE